MWIRAVREAFRTWAEQTLREKPQKANVGWISTGGTLNYDRNDLRSDSTMFKCFILITLITLNFCSRFILCPIHIMIEWSKRFIFICTLKFFHEWSDEVCVIAGVRGSAIWRDDTWSFVDRWSDGVGNKPYWGNRKWKDWGPGGNSEAFGCLVLVGHFEMIWKAKNRPITLGKGKEWEGNDCNNGWT